MPSITLKIDVDTWRGTREGVPNLVRLLRQRRANASFLFSLGPDHTGWALRRAFRPGFFSKVARTSVLQHYGLRSLMHGVLLPAPDIGADCAGEMRSVRDAGFECGIHAWDHVVWQDHVRRHDAQTTRRAMQQCVERFSAIFGSTPRTHGAAGWQMNEHAFRQLDSFGFAYASDGRCRLRADGALQDPQAGPYRLCIGNETLACIQLPTTLPTIDELLGREIGGRVIGLSQIAATLLTLTAMPRDHVFTLHAELEGQKLAPIFEQLLEGWRSQGYDLVSMAEQYQQIKDRRLPSAPLQWGELPGRSGELIVR